MMKEEHIIAALLTAGILAQNRVGVMEPIDAVKIYKKCLSELGESIHPQRYPGNKLQ